MTVKLYEGCWGVTRGGGKQGPMPAKNTKPFYYDYYLAPFGWNEDGRNQNKEGPYDIIAVFATEAEADAYLAGESAEEPKFPEVGSSFDFLRQDGTWIKVRLVPDAPKPVTWPDGVNSMVCGGTTIFADPENGWVHLEDADGQYAPESARHLAALLLAAADKVEGRG